jgi:alpha-tubulin suppressor-like RCC1 family protein
MRSPIWSDHRRPWRVLIATILTTSLGCNDAADSVAGPEPASTLVAAAALAFRQVDEGIEFSCGVTMDDRAYCWGANQVGQLGDGSTTDRLTPGPVAGGHLFRHVSTGSAHACGLTTVNRVYCWGYNQHGRLGDSTSTTRLRPTLISGDRRYQRVRAGNLHTCALTTGGDAYCWGSNRFGQLGIGHLARRRREFPVKVVGGLKFTLISGKNFHVCGLTSAGKAYCWGENDEGRLGDGTTVDRPSPRAVATGQTFKSLNAGGVHSCGIVADDRAFCWGGNPNGELGDGTTAGHLTPKPVAGGLRFDGVSTSRNDHTCGVTLTHRAYCWGRNFAGGLGDGTLSDRLSPTPVAGGLTFVGVTAGYRNTCGRVVTSNAAYCWGLNNRGQLGDGTTIDRLTPVPVAAPTN